MVKRVSGHGKVAGAVIDFYFFAFSRWLAVQCTHANDMNTRSAGADFGIAVKALYPLSDPVRKLSVFDAVVKVHTYKPISIKFKPNPIILR